MNFLARPDLALLRTGLCIAFAAVSTLACAEDAPVVLSSGYRFVEQSGDGLYRAICAGCHMPDGRGAKGAGAYPALAANPRLASATYPAYTVLHGRKGMPPFGKMLSDAQVAEVTNYLRTHFDNHHSDAISPADVKALR